MRLMRLKNVLDPSAASASAAAASAEGGKGSKKRAKVCMDKERMCTSSSSSKASAWSMLDGLDDDEELPRLVVKGETKEEESDGEDEPLAKRAKRVHWRDEEIRDLKPERGKEEAGGCHADEKPSLGGDETASLPVVKKEEAVPE